MSIDSLISVREASKAQLSRIGKLLQAQKPPFVSDEKFLAVLAFGGTIHSAYQPDKEAIIPVAMNPVMERASELDDLFGIAGHQLAGAILVAKDSRKITKRDMVLLIHTIREIQNRKILVSCGTYMLPKIASILDHHFGHAKSDKIIGITGALLPPSLEAQDVDFNGGGTIAAINVFDFMNKRGTVFTQFHGKILVGEDIAKLNLHPRGYKPRLARPLVDVR